MTTRDELLGSWVHSHEESREELVLRPAETKMPPSRGRQTYEFRGDGTFEEGGPGPTDRTETTSGRWSIDGDTLLLTYQDDRPDQAFHVVPGAKRLALRRKR
jgi:hypothetical protein